MGLQRLDGSQVHMSTGLGSTLPVRFLCPPEVVVLHLLAGEGAACGDAMGEPD
jgi:predicted MPP superfamily phosphohydrolase